MTTNLISESFNSTSVADIGAMTMQAALSDPPLIFDTHPITAGGVGAADEASGQESNRTLDGDN